MRLNLMRTGLAKGSIYKAFESKHNLYLKSLERYEAIHVDTTVAALSSSKSAIIRLNDFLSAPIKNVSSDGMNKGCFYVMLRLTVLTWMIRPERSFREVLRSWVEP